MLTPSNGNPYKHLDELIARYPQLSGNREEIDRVYGILRDSYAAGGKLLIAGNGGSCADAEHIVGELMKSFIKPRTLGPELREALLAADPERGALLAERLQQGLPAIALSAQTALATAFANDCDGELLYAQEVVGYGAPGDTFLGITTSGNSANVLHAAVAARAKGMKVLGLLGRDGGKMLPLCDAAIVVPERETNRIQELHLPVYHTLCLMLEEYFF